MLFNWIIYQEGQYAHYARKRKPRSQLLRYLLTVMVCQYYRVEDIDNVVTIQVCVGVPIWAARRRIIGFCKCNCVVNVHHAIPVYIANCVQSDGCISSEQPIVIERAHVDRVIAHRCRAEWEHEREIIGSVRGKEFNCGLAHVWLRTRQRSGDCERSRPFRTVRIAAVAWKTSEQTAVHHDTPDES